MSRATVVVVVALACLAAAAARPQPITMSLNKHHMAPGARPAGGPSVAAAFPDAYAAPDAAPDAPVYGSIWPTSIFWSYIEVGTPARQFPIAIDSGSFTMDIPLKGCKGCITKAPNNQYDPSASSTHKNYPCQPFGSCPAGGICSNNVCSFSNTYETCDPTDPSKPCTIAGGFHTDVVSWGTAGPVNVTFGAIDYQTAGFYQFETVDGVVGMAEPTGAQSVFGTLVADGAVPANVWSICLHDGAKANGTITLGGIDERLYKGEIAYTPDVGQGFYSMNFEGMTVGGKQLSGLGSTIVIDSGTNDLLISQEAVDSMRSIMEGMCSSTNLRGICGSGKSLFDGACYEMSEEDMSKFPDFTLNMQGVALDMTPKDYLLLNQPNAPVGTRCLGVGVIGGGLQIVGDSTMQNYLTIFDIENDRIGWAPVNTDTCGSI